MNERTNVEYTCQIEVLDDAERLRWQTLRRAMHAAREEARELPDGYAVRFKADPALFLQVAEWITLERRCCPFLAFGLDWSQSEAPRLSLTGGPGVKEFLAGALAGKP
jgi:hypothetical protein